VKLKGTVEIWSLDKKGNIKKYIKKHNTILNNGKEIFYKDGHAIGQMGIGTDNTPPDPSQTGLLAEYRREAELGKSSSGDFDLIVEKTFVNFTESVNICEAGLCLTWGSGSYVYLNRVTFDSVTCDENNNIKVKFTLTVID